MRDAARCGPGSVADVLLAGDVGAAGAWLTAWM